jgi:hypothetical protein
VVNSVGSSKVGGFRTRLGCGTIRQYFAFRVTVVTTQVMDDVVAWSDTFVVFVSHKSSLAREFRNGAKRRWGQIWLSAICLHILDVTRAVMQETRCL